MVDTPDRDRERHNSLFLGVTVDARATDIWFLREVLPLEAALVGYFRRNWRNENDVRDLVQDVYVRVYTYLSEVKECDFPQKVRPFVFTTARNLLINRFRPEHVVPDRRRARYGCAGHCDGRARPRPQRSSRAMCCGVCSAHSINCRRVAARPSIMRRSTACRAARSPFAWASRTTVAIHLANGIVRAGQFSYGEPADPRSNRERREPARKHRPQRRSTRARLRG